MLFVFVGIVLVVALSRFHGTVATISPAGIGPLRVGTSTIRQMQDWAVGPIDFWLVDKGNPPVRFSGNLWQYQCVNRATIFDEPCRTLFGFRKGILVTVRTSNPLFTTKKGTRIGAALSDALARDHGTWSGWKVSCPRIELAAPRGITFLAYISRNAVSPKGYVAGFYLSKSPSSFAPCGG